MVCIEIEEQRLTEMIEELTMKATDFNVKFSLSILQKCIVELVSERNTAVKEAKSYKDDAQYYMELFENADQSRKDAEEALEKERKTVEALRAEAREARAFATTLQRANGA